MLIIIEGNIGSGKTTLSTELAEKFGFKLFEEGADTSPKFKEYLKLYYANPERYALEMQFWLMSKRFEQHQTALKHIHTTGQCCVMDRSIYGDTVFAKRNWLDGNISDLGYDSYNKHRDYMLQFLMVPQITIYLDVQPEICLERIVERSRSAEVGIPLKYLQGLDELYKELLKELYKRGSNVNILDWNSYWNVDDVVKILDKFVDDYRWTGFGEIIKRPNNDVNTAAMINYQTHGDAS